MAARPHFKLIEVFFYEPAKLSTRMDNLIRVYVTDVFPIEAHDVDLWGAFLSSSETLYSSAD